MSQVPRTCPACWEQVTDADRFCRTCGKPLEAAAEAATAAAAATPPPAAAASTAPVPAPVAPVPVSRPTVSGWQSPRRGSGAGAKIRRGLAGLGRATLGCLGLLVVVGLLGGVVAGLVGEDVDATVRPDRTSRPSGQIAVPTTGPERTAPLASVVPPMTAAPEPSVAPEPTRLEVDLRDALAGEMVEMTVTGRSLEQLDIELESLVDLPLDLVIDAGLVFKPGSSGVQPMVVIVDTSVSVEPGDTASYTLAVACASMYLDGPDSGDSFRLAAKPGAADLRRLFRVDAFHAADFRVQQFAVWTITDNPTRDGYVGLGYFGVGSGPSNAEIKEIKALFRAAGIDLDKYRAVR